MLTCDGRRTAYGGNELDSHYIYIHIHTIDVCACEWHISIKHIWLQMAVGALIDYTIQWLYNGHLFPSIWGPLTQYPHTTSANSEHEHKFKFPRLWDTRSAQQAASTGTTGITTAPSFSPSFWVLKGSLGALYAGGTPKLLSKVACQLSRNFKGKKCVLNCHEQNNLQ